MAASSYGREPTEADLETFIVAYHARMLEVRAETVARNRALRRLPGLVRSRQQPNTL